MYMEIRVLRYFLTVVREENISKEAEYHAAHTEQTACTVGRRTWNSAVLQGFQKNHIDQ
jgi:hypothetical protein